MPRSPGPYWSVPAPAPVFGFEPPGVRVGGFAFPQAEIAAASAPAATVPPAARRKRFREEASAASSSTVERRGGSPVSGGRMSRGSNQIATAGGPAARPHNLRARVKTVLVAPDSFKGTFSAAEVAAAVACGLRDGGAEAVELPLGDGGEGTLDALAGALGAEVRTARVHDPLGRPVEARFALAEGGRQGIVEMAEASGLRLVAERERDAWAASTYGTGELIAATCEA